MQYSLSQQDLLRIQFKGEIAAMHEKDAKRQTPKMFIQTSTTLADLFTLLFAANPFSAARASLRWWSSDEFEDGLAHGGQCWSRRRPVDSFFPALLFLPGHTVANPQPSPP